jgi:hypothetical protein
MMMNTATAMPALQEGPPFVLVAHDIEGRWDVYAKKFDTPLASFEQRQLACNFASEMAKTRRDCLVLLREPKPAGVACRA